MCGYNLNNSSINRNIKSSSLLNLTEEVHKTTEAKNIITTTKTTTRIPKAAIHHKAISLSRPNAKRNIANAYVKTSYTKWQIVILTFIILLLCCTSHVLAIRKGRLMTPSTFTALSGDLHVQIQFMQDDDNRNINSTATISTTFEATVSNMTTARTKQPSSGNVTETETKTVENIITSTLVISKYIDEVQELTAPEAFPTTTTTVAVIESNDTMIDGKILQRKRKEIVQNIPVYPDPRYNVTQIAVPCQTFIRGGLYEMQVVTNLRTFNHIPLNSTKVAVTSQSSVAKPTMTTSTTTLIPVMDERLKQTLDVRWPSAEMLISPVRLRTYPDRPVEVTLRFPEVNCDQAWRSEDLPEFWLELIYCGKERPCSTLMPQNISKSSVLFAEQVRGYPKYFNVKLNCELFGLAGNYAVQLRPMLTALNVPITRRFLSVDWSEKYVFNVYARSIFPCDPHTGIGVLYEYPGCILEQGDRVRLYAKLRADVASLKPPTTLHYIAEQRVVKNQYSLYFSCDLFTEKYVEYCFVYVSQAISGAVADVRMDCVPTLPVRESDTGGWGPWSEWTPCSTSCLGGTRNRYRFCDSPPPRYGAKFCEVQKYANECIVMLMEMQSASPISIGYLYRFLIAAGMATKGKGDKGKKKKGEKSKEKLSQVDKTFYELTITDLNKKLARLRSHVNSLDDANVALTEKVRNMEEDRVDIAAHLERSLAARDDTILELEENLSEMTKVRNSEKQESAEHIKDLEVKYKAMRNQLTSEIKLLNGKLNSLDEFRIQRDYLLSKYDDQEQELKEKDRLHQEIIYNMEQKAVVEKDALKKEVEAKLLQVSEDFTRSSEIRNAGYTRRLIRENIALQKEIEVLVLAQIRMQRDLEEQLEGRKEMAEQCASLDQLKTQLIYSSQNKVNIIEKLTNRYESLKAKYTEALRYRTLYENIMKRDVCDRFNYHDAAKKLRTLGQKFEKLKIEKNHLLTMHKQHNYEILRLKKVIEQIKTSVTTAIIYQKEREKKGPSPVTSKKDELTEHELTRQGLLSELIEIISSHLEWYAPTPSVLSVSRSQSSIYRPGGMGFLPKVASSLMEIFKHDAEDVTSVAIMSGDFKLQSQASRIIPKARTSNAGSIIDVELGSTLYVSSSHEEIDITEPEEEPGDMGEESSSEEYQPSETKPEGADEIQEGEEMTSSKLDIEEGGQSALSKATLISTKISTDAGGPSVQTEKCGNSVIDTWDCIYESGGAIINNINRTGVSQEIGPGCRCGCIVHLGSSKPKRIIAGATQSCPGRSFWLIQVN
uniref:Cilia- and flagella-associated protein 157 n=1 Tax=Glossina austeni TaxID=7395 RepID=A0A1A9UQT1_GLOAU